MDPGIISTTVEATWTALQPYLPVLATKAVEKVGSELPAAVGKLWSGLRAKFDTRPPAKEALVDMLKNPDDSDLQAAFRVQLKKILENEPAFVEELMGLVKETGARIDIKVRDGAAAVGDRAKAVGKGGTLIEGGVKGEYLGPSAKKTGD